MFPLHDHTRRSLCRFGFLTLCLLPAASVLAWGLSHHLPSHLADVSRQVAAQTNCKAEIASVSYPRPHVTVLHGLVLKDVVTGETLARCEQLKIDDRATTIQISILRPQISAAGLPRLWESLADKLCGWSGAEPVEVVAQTLEVESPRSASAFQDLQMRLQSSETGPQLDARFCHAGMDSSEPAQLRIVWGREDQSLNYEFDTGSLPLPCALMASLAPALETLGPRATFLGHLSLSQSPGGRTGLIGPARIADLELETLMRSCSNRLLSGRGRLDLEMLRIADDAIAAADGELRAGPGEIDAGVLYAFGDAMGVGHGLPGGDRTSKNQSYLYGELALRFSLNADGVLLTGKCLGPNGEALSGVVLTNPSKSAVAREPEERRTIDALVRALTPPVAAYVPATRQAERLLQHLPLPDVGTVGRQ